MVGYLSQGVGVYTMWRIQRKWSISTKTMFNAVAIATIILDAWGVAGIYTQKIGFHNIWEFWFYQVYFGVFVCAWFSFSMTMVCNLVFSDENAVCLSCHRYQRLHQGGKNFYFSHYLTLSARHLRSLGLWYPVQSLMRRQMVTILCRFGFYLLLVL